MLQPRTARMQPPGRAKWNSPRRPVRCPGLGRHSRVQRGVTAPITIQTSPWLPEPLGLLPDGEGFVQVCGEREPGPGRREQHCDQESGA